MTMQTPSLYSFIDEIPTETPVAPDVGTPIGHSRGGRQIEAFRYGHGSRRISLIGGNHADEPVGPHLLRLLVAYLHGLPKAHPLMADYDWWIIPHTNPDGEARNLSWFDPEAEAVDPLTYFRQAVREAPGDDMEFGFPRGPDDEGARPENRAIRAWWEEADGPFELHASLHGMAIAGGPWFLIEPAWCERCDLLKQRCREQTRALDYQLHDIERHGEKGFHRLERGFCTRPDSISMRDHFLERDDAETAARFRPSSMETMRSFGGDCLTLVSEMPLFITPGVGDTIDPDPKADEWRARLSQWRELADQGGDLTQIERDISKSDLHPMPLRDQMKLQWTFITAGLEQASTSRS